MFSQQKIFCASSSQSIKKKKKQTVLKYVSVGQTYLVSFLVAAVYWCQ